METPYLSRSIFGDDFNHVYEPAEDTFLLLDALEQDLENLRTHTSTCIEIGSGSGSVITALSRALNEQASDRSKLFIATDINIRACITTRKCAELYNQTGIQVVRTNMAESLVDRLDGLVDLLVFNPPYVPTSDDEVEQGNSDQIYLSWAGGMNGRRLADLFINSYVTRLLSKPHGVAYMVALESNNPTELSRMLLEKYQIQGSVVLKRKAGIEMLSIIKYSHKLDD